jgi:cytochrome b subunit of formate dehydrogenase
MNARSGLSARTRTNWLINASVFIGGIIAGLSGIYFLFLPSGGYQGGRNGLYGIQILFSRATWDDFHTWGGVIMIGAVALHIVIHWDWIVLMTKRILGALWSKGTQMSTGAKVNVLVDAVIAISFFLTAISGIYFLFAPTGGFQGGNNVGWDPGFLFSRTTWDLIHTWAGVVMIGAAAVHFVIHWRWVKNVTVRFFRTQRDLPRVQTVSSAN